MLRTINILPKTVIVIYTSYSNASAAVTTCTVFLRHNRIITTACAVTGCTFITVIHFA